MNQSGSSRRLGKRPLKLQSLETRQLLAAEFGDSHNVDIPEDVNADGVVSSLDALMVINRLNGRQHGDSDSRVAFRDVNGDGAVTSLDALRVINRMGRRGDSRPDGPRPQPDQSSEVEPGEYRSIDGTGNNLDDPLLGSAGTAFRRLVDSDYADGIADPAGEDRPSAREISNILSAQDGSILSARGLTDACCLGRTVHCDTRR